jgi:hypothetical protein
MVVAKLAFGLAAACVCMTGVRAGGDEVCRPALAFKDVTTTEMLQPPASGRLWFAVVAVDPRRARRPRADRSRSSSRA